MKIVKNPVAKQGLQLLSSTPIDVGLSNVDNVQQLPMSYLDTTTTLGTSDVKVPSQNAVKVYTDTALGAIPTTTAANDVQIGNGSGSWVTKTLAQFVTILRTAFDSVYAAISHTHAAEDITTGLISPASNANDVFRVDNTSGSYFTATINGTPSGASVIYNAPSVGNENALVPYSTSQLAKMRLYNTTRSNYALILDCNTGTNTITLTASAPANWAAGDIITIESQIVLLPIGYVDLEITSGEYLGKSLAYLYFILYAVSAADLMRIHPTEAYTANKQQVYFSQVAGAPNGFSTFVEIKSNVISVAFPASDAFAIREVAVKV